MNLEISDTRTDYPETISYSVPHDVGNTAVARWTPDGALFAVGASSDGTIAIIDTATKSIAHSLVGHVAPVTALCWWNTAADDRSRLLVSASRDWTCAVWRVCFDSIVKVSVIHFESPVLAATTLENQHVTISSPYQKTPLRFVAVCMNAAPVLVCLEETGSGGAYVQTLRTTLVDDGSTDSASTVAEFVQTAAVATVNYRGSRALGFEAAKAARCLVFVGTVKGVVSVVDVETRQILSSFRPSGTAAIKGFQFSPNGEFLAVNSADKTLRCYHTANIMNNSSATAAPATSSSAKRIVTVIEPDYKFFDSIDQNRWITCAFSSPDAKYFIGGSSVKNVHKIYIWERETGALAKFLELPKEMASEAADSFECIDKLAQCVDR
ncbi:chromatin binding protein [Physocladia obscura]|uniref:Chromatin binding protein n=1 Tax=Physocladia obscura TaxID=109957 RepID=A0AAD5T180_9FUNG|nr:chromatin binding protein [Physocladia obscura]